MLQLLIDIVLLILNLLFLFFLFLFGLVKGFLVNNGHIAADCTIVQFIDLALVQVNEKLPQILEAHYHKEECAESGNGAGNGKELDMEIDSP